MTAWVHVATSGEPLATEPPPGIEPPDHPTCKFPLSASQAGKLFLLFHRGSRALRQNPGFTPGFLCLGTFGRVNGEEAASRRALHEAPQTDLVMVGADCNMYPASSWFIHDLGRGGATQL